MSRPTPRLRFVTDPPRPDGIVLLLHGGRESGRGRVRGHHFAVLRMRPIAAQVARIGGDRLAVVRLQYAVRGWNGREQSPVADAEWALDQLRRRYGAQVPIALIGHSMGGRTALRVAGQPGVTSVIALAPWLPYGEPVEQAAGRLVLIVHGSLDRTTDPAGSQTFAAALRGLAVQVSLVIVTGERHPLLRRRRLVDGLASAYARATLIGADHGDAGDESVSDPAANLLRRVLAGEAELVV